MRAKRKRFWLRRAVALLVVAGATAAIAMLISGDEERRRVPVATVTSGVPAGVRDVVAGLTVEEKVGQVLALGFEGTDAAAAGLGEVSGGGAGAIFVGPGNWVDADQGAALIAALKGSAGGGVPPLIVARQEAGPDRAFGDLPPAQRQVAIGDFDDAQRTRRWAREAAAALASAGVDLNLFPIADTGGLSSPIGERAFSEDPGVAARMTLAAVIGCQEAGLACAPGHFPGLGGASADTDLGPATVGIDRETLLGRDVVPFGVATQAGAPAVVLSHAFYAAFDPVTPASQSARIVSGLLRGRVGFQGVAITDDLAAGAVRALGPVRDAAVTSLGAGADLLLIERPGAMQEAARRALVEAVEDGTIPMARLDEAAGRVLQLKRKLGLLTG